MHSFKVWSQPSLICKLLFQLSNSHMPVCVGFFLSEDAIPHRVEEVLRSPQGNGKF